MTPIADDRDRELVVAITNATTREERRVTVREPAKHSIECYPDIHDRLAEK